MTQSKPIAPTPWHVWVVGGLLLLMNAPVAFGYIANLIDFEPYMAQFSEQSLDYYDNTPLWMIIMWGFSILGGVAGAVLLLLRRKLAVPVTAIAWICSVVAAAYSVVNPPPEGASNAVTAIVIVVALLILIYMYRLQKLLILR